MGCGSSTPIRDYLIEHKEGNYGKEEDLDIAFNHLQNHLNLFNHGEITEVKRLVYDGKGVGLNNKEFQEWKIEIAYGPQNKVKAYRIKLYADSEYEIHIHNFDH